MSRYIFSLFICSMFFLSCNNADEKKSFSLKNENTKQDPLAAGDTTSKAKKQVQYDRTDSPYTKITEKSIIEIQTGNKKFDTTSKFLKLYSDRCDAWKLSKKDILQIVRNSKEMDGQEFHHYYDVLPCYYSGKIDIDGKSASYEINGGAFTTLFFKDTSVYLGYKGKDYKRYFLVGPGTK
jgi:hypothetical protein